MEVTNVPIEKVIPYARNPRRNENAIALVASSIEEFGWQQPIVVDSEYVVIAGHTRLEAARKLGMTHVPVMVATDLSEAKVKAYRIADNRLAEEATWNEELLSKELKLLLDAGYDLGLTSLAESQIDALLADEVEGNLANPSLAEDASQMRSIRPIIAFKIGKYAIPMTDAEAAALTKYVDGFVDKTGAVMGVITVMLDINPASDIAPEEAAVAG